MSLERYTSLNQNVSTAPMFWQSSEMPYYRNTGPNPYHPAYKVGAAIREAYDNLYESLPDIYGTLSYVYQKSTDSYNSVADFFFNFAILPGAEAAPVARKEKVEPIENIIKKLTLTIDLDDSTRRYFSGNGKKNNEVRDRINKDLSELTSQVKEEMLRAAHEGAETESELRQCLKYVNNVVVFHPEWSREKISRYPLMGAFYNHNTNSLGLLNKFGGKYLAPALIHECWHAIETKFSKGEYNAEKLDYCRSELIKLQLETITCFEGKAGESVDCARIEELSAAYEHRPLIIPCKRVAVGPELEVEVNKFGNFPGRKIKEKMIFVAESGSDLCALAPESVVRDEKRVKATHAEKNIMNMIMSLDHIPKGSEEIQKTYSNLDKVKQSHEYRANIFDKVPEMVSKKACPDFRSYLERNGQQKEVHTGLRR